MEYLTFIYLLINLDNISNLSTSYEIFQYYLSPYLKEVRFCFLKDKSII